PDFSAPRQRELARDTEVGTPQPGAGGHPVHIAKRRGGSYRNMDLSLESALSAPESGAPSGSIAGRPVEEWNAAYAKVESYFHALRIRNKTLLGRLVILVLKRAMRRAPQELQLSATELAAEEMDSVVTEWFGQVLQEAPVGATHMLSTRGRLALL